jgi:hypothetical protein
MRPWRSCSFPCRPSEPGSGSWPWPSIARPMPAQAVAA